MTSRGTSESRFRIRKVDFTVKELPIGNIVLLEEVLQAPSVKKNVNLAYIAKKYLIPKAIAGSLKFLEWIYSFLFHFVIRISCTGDGGFHIIQKFSSSSLVLSTGRILVGISTRQ